MNLLSKACFKQIIKENNKKFEKQINIIETELSELKVDLEKRYRLNPRIKLENELCRRSTKSTSYQQKYLVRLRIKSCKR